MVSSPVWSFPPLHQSRARLGLSPHCTDRLSCCIVAQRSVEHQGVDMCLIGRVATYSRRRPKMARKLRSAPCVLPQSAHAGHAVSIPSQRTRLVAASSSPCSSTPHTVQLLLHTTFPSLLTSAPSITEHTDPSFSSTSTSINPPFTPRPGSPPCRKDRK